MSLPLPAAVARAAHARAALALFLLSLVGPTARPAAAQAPGTPAPAARLLRPTDVDTLPLRSPGERIAYGRDSLQFGELRLPPGSGRVPLVIVIHGGCWYGPYANARNAAPLADALAAQGVATWNIEYRRYDHPGGGWPGTFTDVADAADHVRRLAAAHPIDTTRVIAIGHSAGAQLAAWLATRHRLERGSPLHRDAPLRLAGVVALGGVMDLREFEAREQSTCGIPAVASLLGGAPAQVPDRLLAVSPAERLPLGVPHHHVAGALDRIAPAERLHAFAEAARARGDAVTVTLVPGLGHHDVMAPRTAGGAAAIAAVLTLLDRPPR
jgi:acetyl esterase/lipase